MVKEKQIPVGIVLHESILKEIRKRLKKTGMKLSPLIENLLMVWAIKLDRADKRNKEYYKELDEKLREMSYEEMIEQVTKNGEIDGMKNKKESEDTN